MESDMLIVGGWLIGDLEVVVVVCWSLRVDCVMKVRGVDSIDTIIYYLSASSRLQ
jgi:hypothetical protein